ncbi:hypothetical protein CBJ89_001944 [Salmonella enterica subsp. enterica serovar Essen]|nr:hypothetical protein [Salmonella enterica]ECI7957512.1 hypothetical protein [Salmonella enterica subsp. enterica]EDU3844904.1 hypothetical protein [Salmonella enterica subsp. enterica serovar Essen]MBH0683332.1 hypothetical protein [Salmonella enterica]
MPHSPPTMAMLVELYRQHKTPLDIFFIILFVVIGRVFYCGGKIREAIGDVVIGTTLVTLLSAKIPSISLLPLGLNITVDHHELAFMVGILGIHGVKEAAYRFLKSRFGIDVRTPQQTKETK